MYIPSLILNVLVAGLVVLMPRWCVAMCLCSYNISYLFLYRLKTLLQLIKILTLSSENSVSYIYGFSVRSSICSSYWVIPTYLVYETSKCEHVQDFLLYQWSMRNIIWIMDSCSYTPIIIIPDTISCLTDQSLMVKIVTIAAGLIILLI